MIWFFCFVQGLDAKTKELIEKLQTLGGENESDLVDISLIKEKGMNKNIERFLCNLAYAENLVST